MAINESGLNNSGAEAAIENVISNGADVHLLTTEADITDTTTDLEDKSSAVESVAESVFTINSATSFSDTNSLEVTEDIEFGALDIGTVFNIAIVGSDDNALIGVEETQPELTGENYTIPQGETVYELGNA